MATGAAIAAGVAGLTQAAVGVTQSVKAKNQIEDFEIEKSYNPYETLSVSTAGGELQMEQANKGLATAADTISQGGSRAAGNINSAVGQTNQVTEKVAADFDAQEKAIAAQVAQGDWQVQQAEKQEDYMELSGYANLMNHGQSMVGQGGSTTVGAAALGLNGTEYSPSSNKTPVVDVTKKAGGGNGSPIYNPYSAAAMNPINLAQGKAFDGGESKSYF